MKRGRAFVLVLCIVALLALVGSAFANAPEGYDLSWKVIGGGGGRATSAEYALEGTIGQAAIGPASGGNYQLGGGFWYGLGEIYRVYLPLVLKLFTQ